MLNGLAANCEQLMQAIAGTVVLSEQCLWEKVQVVSRLVAKKVGEFTTVTFIGGTLTFSSSTFSHVKTPGFSGIHSSQQIPTELSRRPLFKTMKSTCN